MQDNTELLSKIIGLVYSYKNSFSPHLCQYLVLPIFLILAMLLGAEWYVIVILFCISLIIVSVFNQER